MTMMPFFEFSNTKELLLFSSLNNLNIKNLRIFFGRTKPLRIEQNILK